MRPDLAEIDPRESFRYFPNFLQPIITLVSGKPLSGAIPKYSITPFQAISIDFLKYLLGIIGAGESFMAGGFLLIFIPVFWILTVNGARSLTSDAHYAGHGAVTGNDTIDKIIGEILSLVVVAPNMDDYAHGHNSGHHGRSGIGTIDDPDVALMQVIGFETGRSLKYYRIRHALAIISPRYHIIYTLLRMKSTFITATYWRILLGVLLYGGAIYWSISTQNIELLVLSWLIPIFPLYAVSAALQFPSEHSWLARQNETETRAEYLFRSSHGRFFLIKAPDQSNFFMAIIKWMEWLFEMMPMLFQRFFVCVSILPAHDYHHRFVCCRDWPMEPWLRQQEIDRGAVYQQYYGLRAPTAAQFKIWASLPINVTPRPKTFLALFESFFRGQ